MFYSYNGHYNRHYNSKDTISPLHFTPELIEKIAGLVKMSTRGLLARLLGCLLGVKCHRDINRQKKRWELGLKKETKYEIMEL